MHDYSDWPHESETRKKPMTVIGMYDRIESANQAFRTNGDIRIPLRASDLSSERALMAGCTVVEKRQSSRERIAKSAPKYDEVVLTGRNSFTISHYRTNSAIDDAARLAWAVGRAHCMGLSSRNWRNLSRNVTQHSLDQNEMFTQAIAASLMIPTNDLREALCYSNDEQFLRGYFRVPPHILRRKLYDLAKYEKALLETCASRT